MVSIIVPIYKAEKYLHRCIDSILAQTFSDFELLLVIDGSPDNSGAICDEYALKDLRIRVLHKENGGVSSARNLGLDNACGEWVAFIDADDWIGETYLEYCVSAGIDVDLVRVGIKRIYDEKTTIEVRQSFGKRYSTVGNHLKKIVSRSTTLGVWGGLYRLSYLNKFKIRFREGLKMGEDWLFSFEYLKHCSSVILVTSNLYYYNKINEESCVNNISFEKDIQLLSVTSEILNDELIRSPKFYISKSTCKTKVLYEVLSHVLSISKTKEERKRLTALVFRKNITSNIIELIVSRTNFKHKLFVIVASSFLWGVIFQSRYVVSK